MTPPLLTLRLFISFRGWVFANVGRDVLAGLTLVAITIPEQMATAKLGGFLESVRAQDALDRFGILTALGASHLFHSVEEAVTTLLPG